jgi:hypothetical protein
MEMASLGAMEGRCGLLPGLSRSQRLICLRHPDAMDAVVEGLAMAIENCESQFRSQRWNCSALQGAGFGLAPLKGGAEQQVGQVCSCKSRVGLCLRHLVGRSRACSRTSVRSRDGSRVHMRRLSSTELAAFIAIHGQLLLGWVLGQRALWESILETVFRSQRETTRRCTVSLQTVSTNKLFALI